jgi:hypothetical protein
MDLTAFRTKSMSTSEAYLSVHVKVGQKLGEDNLLLELRQNFSGVLFSCQSVHDLKFCKLEVYRVVVLAEENLNIVSEYGRTPLDDQENIPQRHVLHFWTGGQDRN